MKLKFFVLSFLSACLTLLGTVEQSIIPLMDQLPHKDLSEKIPACQQQIISSLICNADKKLRVMSFNLLFNLPLVESELDLENRWEKRKHRVIEYLSTTCPDLIGTQELQEDQLADLSQALEKDYGFYGIGIDGAKKGDIPAIFYRKERLELISSKTSFYSNTPWIPSAGPFGKRNTVTICCFKDKITQQKFLMLNTHLAYGNIERRYYEASFLRDLILNQSLDLPVILTGDFNTFPFRQDIEIPFYDGDFIVKLIEDAQVKDSLQHSALGHLGPLSSTNFCPKKQKSFCSEGEPGVILDHIFVSNEIKVLCHGIDPARVNKYFPSDHFPVIADLLLIGP